MSILKNKYMYIYVYIHICMYIGLVGNIGRFGDSGLAEDIGPIVADGNIGALRHMGTIGPNRTKNR